MAWETGEWEADTGENSGKVRGARGYVVLWDDPWKLVSALGNPPPKTPCPSLSDWARGGITGDGGRGDRRPERMLNFRPSMIVSSSPQLTLREPFESLVERSNVGIDRRSTRRSSLPAKFAMSSWTMRRKFLSSRFHRFCLSRSGWTAWKMVVWSAPSARTTAK